MSRFLPIRPLRKAQRFQLRIEELEDRSVPSVTSIALDAPAVTWNANGTVTVNVTSDVGTPTGDVSLSVDAGWPDVQPLVNGSAVFSIPNPFAGTHSLLASYDAQGGFDASSQSGAFTVTPAATSIAVNAPTVSDNGDGTVTVTVNSASGTPTGEISLTVDDGEPLVQPLIGGSAVFSIPDPSAGGHTLVATYTPYPNRGIPAAHPGIVAWATGVAGLTRGPQDIANPAGPVASFGTEVNALGAADGTFGVVSLGDGGQITVTFDQSIVNGPGPDFAVFENGFAFSGFVFGELAFVDVSSDGVNFFRFPAVSLTQTQTQVGPWDGLEPTQVHNLAGQFPALEGTPFDLQDLDGVSPLLDLNNITHVRLTDVVGAIDPSLGTLDSLGRAVNEPHATPFASSGFDLDAVGVIHQAGSGSSSSYVPQGNFEAGTQSGSMTVANVPPSNVSAGPDRMVPENTPVTLHGSFTGLSGDTFTFRWRLRHSTNGQAVAQGTSQDFSFIPRDNGVYTFQFTVMDDDGSSVSDSVVVTVRNVAPTAGITGPARGVRGQSLLFTLTAADVSPRDQAARFTYFIDWDGNGVIDQRIRAGASLRVRHWYAQSGRHRIGVRAMDDDGGVSATSRHTIAVAPVALLPDPVTPARTALVIGGTAGNDTIRISRGALAGTVIVSINGVPKGRFAPTGHVVVRGLTGNDAILLGSGIGKRAQLYGGAGHDTLQGGAGADALLGSSGSDLLLGEVGRDLLIGGAGGDRLLGGAHDDILIGGATAFDGNPVALDAVLKEWGSGRGYAARAANLRGIDRGAAFDARLNHDFFLIPRRTVFEDRATDVLFGDRGRDLLFARLANGGFDMLI